LPSFRRRQSIANLANSHAPLLLVFVNDNLMSSSAVRDGLMVIDDLLRADARPNLDWHAHPDDRADCHRRRASNERRFLYRSNNCRFCPSRLADVGILLRLAIIAVPSPLHAAARALCNPSWRSSA
jgi:hypothetical protein